MSGRWVGKAVLAVAAIVGALAAPVEAVPVIRFDNFVDTGLLEYDTVGGTLTGTGIGFDFIVVTGTGILTDGTYTCLGCVLTFETGANTGFTGGLFPTWTWAAGGTFSIEGEIVGVTTGSVTILTGAFTAASALGADSFGGGADFIVFSGIGFDSKDGELLDHLGLTGEDFRFASTDISSTGTIDSDGTFEADVDEADVTNTVVPEPSSTLLVLLGLGSLAAYRRRSS